MLSQISLFACVGVDNGVKDVPADGLVKDALELQVFQLLFIERLLLCLCKHSLSWSSDPSFYEIPVLL